MQEKRFYCARQLLPGNDGDFIVPIIIVMIMMMMIILMMLIILVMIIIIMIMIIISSTGRLSLIRQLWDREGAGLSIFPDY